MTARSRHGTPGRYSAGCRCDDCRAAHTAHARRYRAGIRAKPSWPSATARLASDVRRDGGCLRWTGAHDAQGYGQINFNGTRTFRAHVAAAILAGIDIPPGMVIDHVWARGCRHRDCVLPAHLEVVTPGQNTLRGFGPTAVNARKTHCKRGHEFTPDNTIQSERCRRCRICMKAAWTRSNERHRLNGTGPYRRAAERRRRAAAR